VTASAFTVRIAHNEISFPCAPGETLLDAAHRAGLDIPYSCRKGVCLTCRAAVLDGMLDTLAGPVLATPGAPAEALLCQARPRSDLVVAPRRVARPLALFQPREVEARVFRRQRVAPGVVRLELRHPIGQRVAFRAGQSLEVLLPDGARRSYSMANAPSEADGVELHVRMHPGGAFSDRLLRGLVPGDVLRLVLPFGEVAPNAETEKPLLLLATGTGFAPIASILREAARRRWRRPLALYRGGRVEEDLYLRDVVSRCGRRLPGFRNVEVLSRPGAGWPGRTGHVQQAVAAEWPDMTSVEVYAAGSPAMVAGARALLAERCGLPEDAFFSHAFVASD
jgi:CDP-4-dehydro-6-deoxyglucose reductase/3-phenylpropionate/trans-cinnamate dioxygenase ferredoxin reductase subunit